MKSNGPKSDHFGTPPLTKNQKIKFCMGQALHIDAYQLSNSETMHMGFHPTLLHLISLKASGGRLHQML